MTPTDLNQLMEDHVDLIDRAVRRVGAPAHLRDEVRGGATLGFVKAAHDMRLDAVESVGAVLYTGAVRGAIDELRKLGGSNRRDGGRGHAVHMAILRASSLNVAVGDDGDEVGDLIAAPDSSVEEIVEARQALRDRLAVLTERQREVALRSAAGLTHAETGEAMGISQNRIDQLATLARRKAETEVEMHRLSAREVEVTVCAAEGQSNEETAGRLGLSVETVKTYRKHVIAKLGVRNMTHAVAVAVAAGLIEFGWTS